MSEGKAYKRGRTRAPASSSSKVAQAETTYSSELMQRICAEIAAGQTVTAVLRGPGMPSRTCFYSWIKKHSEAAALYHDARLARADYCRDKIEEINGKLERGEVDPASAKQMSDNYKWLAKIDAPATYSDRVEMTGAAGTPLVPEKNEKPTDPLELARWIAYCLGMAEHEAKERAEQANFRH